MTDNFKGFDLFNDVEDIVLRNDNRGTVLANIAEDNTDRTTKRVNMKGSSLILSYFDKVPDEEKAFTQEAFKRTMERRGFRLTA